MNKDHPSVAIINSLEVTELIKDYFTILKLPVSTLDRRVLYQKDVKEGIMAFIENTSPQFVIWSIPPPYRENWELYQEIRSSLAGKGINFIVITLLKDDLDRAVGYPTEAQQFSGKIEELDEICRSVREKFAVQKERER